ncbi:metallophosphoesterase [Flavobacterium sp. NRK F10]|uniref:metallophosphoesterase n=1 Tax=Flavobacterium sp. NRK F10 TaxID=2954931 RepID=UPI002091A556|nr:metallophosphoesterase [Flavobacterium sp. NRK F10]MCO6175128.1 metallophosphoesterase [Flavobacterium sp. NRK F10]
MYRIIVPILIFLFIEIYSFQAVKTAAKSKWVLLIYGIISVVFLLYLAYYFFTFDRNTAQDKRFQWTIGLFLLLYLPKIILTLTLFSEDVFRLFQGVFQYFSKNEETTSGFLPERRKFVSQMALALAAVPFTSLLYGMTKGKYNFKVMKQTLFFPDLPDDFDGTTITHISDIHSGSFDDAEKIQYAIDLINEQQSDLVLFTGDIVNTHAKEMLPWIDIFKKIHNPVLGKYSVLGNHDYGEYYQWNSQGAKDQNFQAIKELHKKIDFKLLLNENVAIKRGAGEIKLVGVENWGMHFKKAGDLAKASEGIQQKDFKILMSHDPSHWEHEVKTHSNNYHLTLSGHTHGFQFGIEIPGWIKWSPVQYMYKQWAGLYENAGRYVYVNRGFGFHAYPGRVGIMPEITVIELKKGENVA